MEAVRGIDVEALVAAGVLAASHDVACLHVSGTGGAAFVLCVIPRYAGTGLVVPLALTLVAVVSVQRLVGSYAHVLIGGRPVAVAARVAGLVDVVGIAEEGEASIVGVTESEGTEKTHPRPLP